MAERLAPSEKHKFIHNGVTVYEWDQTLTELNMYIPVPPDLKAKEIFCDITKQHIKFGRKGNPPFLDMDLHGPVKVSDCIWTLGNTQAGYLFYYQNFKLSSCCAGCPFAAIVEDQEMHITLAKFAKGEPWPAVIKGHELDPIMCQQDQQRLLLERFQREHPGFDFSNATFNGEAPNARTFMGGLAGDAVK